jgi:hypothetical protein
MILGKSFSSDCIGDGPTIPVAVRPWSPIHIDFKKLYLKNASDLLMEYSNTAVNVFYLDSMSEEFIQPDVFWYGFLEYSQHSSLLLSVEKYFTHGVQSLEAWDLLQNNG